jgi:hypothetical protein
MTPRGDQMRTLAQAAFVYEDDDPAFVYGILSTGQKLSFQSRVANSFRSQARPTGRWQIQPGFFRRIHHMPEVIRHAPKPGLLRTGPQDRHQSIQFRRLDSRTAASRSTFRKAGDPPVGGHLVPTHRATSA